MPKLPFSVYAFWLFNTSGICRKIDKAGDNHDILLVIDGERGFASLLIGYGLEPFISAQHVAEILESGQTQLKAGSWSEAVNVIIKAADARW